MNFLAHFVLATQFLEPRRPLPAYVLGNTLPDLLPLAAPRARFRAAPLGASRADTPTEAALRDGILTHLATDAAFHKTTAFTQVQVGVKTLLREAGFEGMRVRPFFIAHVLAELALDAALLRAEPGLADAFYAALAPSDFLTAARWTEEALSTPLPELPAVLTRFTQSRYLASYRDATGVAEGLTRLCARARQDTFQGTNFTRLVTAVAPAVSLLHSYAPTLLAETRAAIRLSPAGPESRPGPE